MAHNPGDLITGVNVRTFYFYEHPYQNTVCKAVHHTLYGPKQDRNIALTEFAQKTWTYRLPHKFRFDPFFIQNNQ